MKFKHLCKQPKQKLVLLAALVLVLGAAVGGTIAYLVTNTAQVKNTFIPSEVTTTIVEKFDGTAKSDVKIQNKGNIDAWLRAAVVITWQDKDGNVYGTAPVEGTDYTITWSMTNWLKGADGFYYYTKPVAPDGLTEVLFTDCKQIVKAPTNEDNDEKGYFLNVEVIGSGIQSVPAYVFDTKSGWGVSSGLKVDETNNKLVVKATTGGGE